MSSPRCGDCWCATRRTRSLPAWSRRCSVRTTEAFTLRLKEPFHYVEFLLCGSNGVMGGIMREKDALTDPFTPIKSRIGSGPFRFVEYEYQPGQQAGL